MGLFLFNPLRLIHPVKVSPLLKGVPIIWLRVLVPVTDLRSVPGWDNVLDVGFNHMIHFPEKVGINLVADDIVHPIHIVRVKRSPPVRGGLCDMAIDRLSSGT